MNSENAKRIEKLRGIPQNMICFDCQEKVFFN